MAVGNNNQIEKRLWVAAEEIRANSNLKSTEYSIPGKFDFVIANPSLTEEPWCYGMRVRQHGHCLAATKAVR